MTRTIVAGGTGNVGTFIVRALLERGASVTVPSRSAEAIASLREHLQPLLRARDLDRLQTVVTDIGNGNGPLDPSLRGADAVIASLGKFVPAASVLRAPLTDLDAVLDLYVRAHFAVAQKFLPELIDRRGTYIFINGPLAFESRPGMGGDLVSIATAAQHMLFRTLADELKDSGVRVAEIVNYAFIRNRRTQPGSAVPGEATGALIADLVTDGEGDIHGQSIHVRETPTLA